MAHELSFQNGEAEAIYSGQRESVWHRLGRYFGNTRITIEQLRAVVGIPVEKVPVRYTIPVANGTDTVEKESTKAFLTVRMDTGEELASVGPDYTVVQHDTALVQAVEPIVSAGLATIDAAGLLRQGAGGWTLLKWNLEKMDGVIRDVYRDELRAYGLCLSWHDGTSSNSYANVTERAVCKNTIDIGMANAALVTRVIHRKNANVNQLAAAQKTFSHVIAHHQEMADAYVKLQQTYLDRQQWIDAVMVNAAPDPRKAKNFDPKSPRAELVVERWKVKVKRLHDLWSKGTGHIGDGSAWEAYNGLVESLDHDADLWKARSAENRVLSLTDGPLSQIRGKVFNSLLALAK